MAGEIKATGPGTGRTVYATILGSGQAIWSTSGGTGAFSAFNSGLWPSYAVTMTEQGASNVYVGDMPAACPAGVFDVVARQQVGGTAAQTDPSVATGSVEWNGSKVLPLSDLATSGQLGQFVPVRLARGMAVSGFVFKLVSAADNVTPFTSGVVSGQVSINGGTFGALASGNVTEMGLGFYRVPLTSGDMLGDVIALSFSAVGVSGGSAAQRDFVVYTQKVSGAA